jgi:hypothetical protein
MTQAEKDQLLEEAAAAINNGDMEVYKRLRSEFPVDASYAMGLKDILGGDKVKAIGFNLSEVEAQYGPNWYR